MRRLLVIAVACASLVATLAANASAPPEGGPIVKLGPEIGLTGPVQFLVTYDPARATGPDLVDKARSAGATAYAYRNFPFPVVVVYLDEARSGVRGHF